MAALRQEAAMAALHETYADDRTATRFDLAYASVMTLIIVCTVLNEMLRQSSPQDKVDALGAPLS